MVEYKIGDKVKLKSGGPTMTVSEINFSDVSCQWFDGSKVMSATFTNEVLEKFRPVRLGGISTI